LVIRTAKEDVGYSIGCMGTDGPGEAMYFEQAFGRFEARIKYGTQPGHGGAFWLFTEGVFSIDGSGRDGSEIDIVERIWLEDQVDHAIHWDGYGDEHQSDARFITGRGLDDGDWHTYRLDWYPDQYVFFIDDEQTWRTSAGGVSQVPAFVLVCDEIVSWGTGPIEDADLPDYLRFDYVRVWEYVPPDGSGRGDE
jgi:beta-glucanase (GH16 family)